jgi:hypothetical protein
MSFEKYVQFPLCGLALPDELLIDRLISYGFIEAGLIAMRRMDLNERREACKSFGLSKVTQCDSWELAARIGAQVCAITIGTLESALARHNEVSKHHEKWEERNGADPLVRIKKHIMFNIRDARILSMREFRVLAAIYSSIGRSPYRAITEPVIRVRAVGCKCKSIFDAENGLLPVLLTEKQIRGTVTSLHETGWFARITPHRHGRKTFYSHRLTDSELRERLFASLTYSRKFAGDRRVKDQDLAERIQKVRGDYNSGGSSIPTQAQEIGRQEGDARATKGRREGDYDINTLNRNSLDKKSIDTDTQPLAADSSIEVLGMLNLATSPPKPKGKDGYLYDGKVFMSRQQAAKFQADNSDAWRKMKEAFKNDNGVVTLK